VVAVVEVEDPIGVTMWIAVPERSDSPGVAGLISEKVLRDAESDRSVGRAEARENELFGRG
jgi:hypothetical protein